MTNDQIRAQPYIGRPSAYRNPGERIPSWRCLCSVPSYKRHSDPWLCVPAHELARWRLAHPEVTTSDRNARCLLWMAKEFGR